MNFGFQVTVNYRLPLHLAPSWFTECWKSWQNDSKEKSILVNMQDQQEKEEKFVKVKGEMKRFIEDEGVMEKDKAKETLRAGHQETKVEKSNSEKWDKVEVREKER